MLSQALRKEGIFITFEGGEGSGKTTQIQILKRYLSSIFPNTEIVISREPGGTEDAEQIREILVNGATDKLSAKTETLLMIASRAEHVEHVILPALQRGAIVLCDRFKDSSIVYQGIANDIPKEEIDKIHEFALKPCDPDLTILLDIPVETGIKRAMSRNQADQRFEQKGSEFHEKIRRGYLTLASLFPNRIKIINAEQNTDDISSQISQVVMTTLNKSEVK